MFSNHSEFYLHASYSTMSNWNSISFFFSYLYVVWQHTPHFIYLQWLTCIHTFIAMKVFLEVFVKMYMFLGLWISYISLLRLLFCIFIFLFLDKYLKPKWMFVSNSISLVSANILTLKMQRLAKKSMGKTSTYQAIIDVHPKRHWLQ